MAKPTPKKSEKSLNKNNGKNTKLTKTIRAFGINFLGKTLVHSKNLSYICPQQTQ